MALADWIAGFPIVALNPDEHQDHQWLNRQEVELRERRLTGGLPPVKKGWVTFGLGICRATTSHAKCPFDLILKVLG